MKLLEKDAPLEFSENYLAAFNFLKKKFTQALILIALDWNLPFELMCDVSDHVVGAVLGQRKDKNFQLIYCARKSLISAQENYTTMKKRVVYSYV